MATKLSSLNKSWTILKSKDKNFEGNVAAIDFGTTCCSLAYCFTGCAIESLKINGVYDRVPTAILLKKRQNEVINVVDIGFNAQQRYKNLPAGRYEDHLYFECFEMQLRDESVSIIICVNTLLCSYIIM